MKHILLLLSSLLTLSSCLPTMSTMLDTARPLNPGEVSVQGSASYYGGILSRVRDQGDFGTRSLNVGGSLQVGLADRLTLRGRYESYSLRDRVELIDGPILSEDGRIDYVETSLKWCVLRDRSGIYVSLLLPFGYYLHEEVNIFTVTPAGMITYQVNDKMDVTFQSKFHYLSGGGDDSADITAGFGIGFSNDLNRWAIRPEIATNFFNVTFGVGFSAVLNPK